MIRESIEKSVVRSLETAGYSDVPAVARERLESYAREVGAWSERMHLVGRGRLGINIELLLLDSLLLLRIAEERAGDARRVADVGSGAGFPGMVWKIVRPALEMTLFERRLKPGLFLERVAAQLGLEDIRIAQEDAGGCREHEIYDLVVSKGAGRFGAMLPLAERLLVPGGAYLTVKGKKWKSELPGPAKGRMQLEYSVCLPERRGTAVCFRKATSR